MTLDLEPEEIEYLSVVVAQDIRSDRHCGLDGVAARRTPVLNKLTTALDQIEDGS